jgi:hypothetical protein
MEFDGSPVFNFDGKGLSFVHSAFAELLECRSVLRHSYAFSYLRYPTFSSSTNRFSHLHGKRKEKMHFERIQSELEILTEQMSDIVARSHLRATQVQISFLTAGAAEKRVEFTNLMFQIFKEEKKEIAKFEQRKLNEAKNGPKSPGNNILSRTTGPLRTLSQLMAMHEMNRFDDSDLTRALDGFLARTGGIAPAIEVDHGRTRHRGRDGAGFEDMPTQMWACSRCTYMNDGGRRCEMCGTRRATPYN